MKTQEASSKEESVFEPRNPDEALEAAEPEVHMYGKSFVCSTDTRGHAKPRNRSRLEIVVDTSEGKIPLWGEDLSIRWRFNEPSMTYFQNPDLAKAAIRVLFAEALLEWGDAVPIRFAENSDTWDFELKMSNADNCSLNGCTLARAFFPDPGRHDLAMYPKMFTQSRKEQVDTFIHELGHVFGLRHFFANVSETEWASEIFGVHNKFSIMNYGADSTLTDADKADLGRLYQTAWSGELEKINGTDIVFLEPYHYGLISSPNCC